AEEAPQIIWHDVECGFYRADLPLWQELADAETAARPGPVLDVGAGTGRVALHLARARHRVTAVDCEESLLRALRERATGPSEETARSGDHVYVSRAIRVRARIASILIVRERRIRSPRRRGRERAAGRDVIELARVSRSQLEREGREAGLTPLPARVVEPT